MSETKDEMRYDLLVQQALRGVVKTALELAVKDGLPGEHHFFVAFSTTAPGVQISSRLRERYPEEMTIVLQHEFLDLEVTAERFSVKLFFNRIQESLVVPFAAIKGFHDPSVQFTLQFAIADEPAKSKRQAGHAGGNDDVPATDADVPVADSDTIAQNVELESHNDASEEPSGNGDGAEVVSLDQFRKK